MRQIHWMLAAAFACGGVLHAPQAAAQLNGGAVSLAGEPYGVAAVSYPSATQAAVSWSSNAPAVSAFKVERRIAGSRAWVPVTQVGDGVRSVIDSGLLPSTSYEYRVSALRPGSTAALVSTGQVVLATPPASASTGDYTAAAAPRRLAAQPMNSTEIMLEWQDATPDETGFSIERSDAGSAWRVVDTVAPGTTVYRDRNLQAGAAYQYRVSAMRSSGNGVPSVPATAATPAAGVTAVYYVDAVNGLNANPGTEARPWQTIQKAHGVLLPGQTVLVRKGTYTSTTNYTVVGINKSGAEGAYITYRNYPGERPLIKTTKGINHHGIEVRDAAWIIIDGFEVEGHVKQITYEEAKAQNDLALAYSKMVPQKYITAIVDSNGISLAGKTVNKTHHIIVRNNYVHDTPGGGIGGGLVDYVTIDGNRTANTSAYSPYGTSGISLLVPYNLDSNTSSYKMIVTNNVATEASNLFPCNCFSFKQPTDGNGIIIDSFNKQGYTGRTLVANNIVHNNGGRGIHSLNSNYIDIFNNTAYRNSTIPITGEGEISLQKTRYARVYNNIFVAAPDRPLTNLFQSPSDIDISYNLMFGGNRNTATPGAVGNVIADPRFTASTGAHMFQLGANSPAVNGANAGFVVLPSDLRGAPRPRGTAADLGAIESF